MPVEFKSQGWMLRLRSENMDPSLCSGISPICRSTVTDQGDKSCYFEQCSWDQEVCRLPGWLCHIKDTVVMHSEECCYFLFLPGSRRNQCQPHKCVPRVQALMWATPPSSPNSLCVGDIAQGQERLSLLMPEPAMLANGPWTDLMEQCSLNGKG